MIKALIISRYFPPDGLVGGVRMARFAAHLPEYGIQPVVLTQPAPAGRAWSTELNGIETHRVAAMTGPMQWWEWWKGKNKAASSATSNTADMPPASRGGLRDNLGYLLQTPDQQNIWYLPALRKARELIQAENIDVIVTTAPPFTVHLVGKKLKKQFGIPWIADFRDPWTAEATRSDLPEWRKRLELKLERECIEGADRVLLKTERMRQLFVKNYPAVDARKFVTLTNGFDSVTIAAPPKRTINEKVLLHLGSLYGGRRVEGFFAALESLAESDPSLRFLQVGDHSPWHVESAKKNASRFYDRGRIEFFPRVPPQEALERMWQADVLVAFQGDHTLQVPAKFYEYLQTGKPVFAVAEKGALSDLIEQTKCGFWAAPEDEAQLRAQLAKVLESTPKDPLTVQAEWAEEFAWKKLSNDFARIVKDASLRGSAAGAL